MAVTTGWCGCGESDKAQLEGMKVRSSTAEWHDDS